MFWNGGVTKLWRRYALCRVLSFSVLKSVKVLTAENNSPSSYIEINGHDRQLGKH